jgi:TPP-dependent pyruvate/acetoin dehydrogenase alpha subunit
MKQSDDLALYRKLILAREAENMIRQEYFKDEMKTPVHLGVGGEAIPVGVCHVLPSGSQTFGTYRNHALYLAMSGDIEGFFAELYGKSTGSGKGKAGSMHLSAPEHGLLATSAVVGTTIPVAVGAALAHAYRQEKTLVAAFFGDGALEEGVFWESMNFACLRRLRILFVCEDNGLAIHTPMRDRQGFRSIEEVLRAFPCHQETGDGTDLPQVVDRARRLIARMEAEPAPGFLHLTYFRFLEHVGPLEDFAVGYRPKPAPEELESLDPLVRYEKELIGIGYTRDELRMVRKSVEDSIHSGVQKARQASFPPASELFTDVFA